MTAKRDSVSVPGRETPKGRSTGGSMTPTWVPSEAGLPVEVRGAPREGADPHSSPAAIAATRPTRIPAPYRLASVVLPPGLRLLPSVERLGAFISTRQRSDPQWPRWGIFGVALRDGRTSTWPGQDGRRQELPSAAHSTAITAVTVHPSDCPRLASVAALPSPVRRGTPPDW